MPTPVFVRLHVSTKGSRWVFEGFGDQPPLGYYQRVGATADDPADLHAILKQYVASDTGGQLLEVDAVEAADLDGAHRDLKECCTDVSVRGVWYSSGRGFYSDDGDDEDGEEVSPDHEDDDSEDEGSNSGHH
jgi:hypothetical protein